MTALDPRQWPAALREDWEERAAILEAEGLDRRTAELRAEAIIRDREAKGRDGR